MLQEFIPLLPQTLVPATHYRPYPTADAREPWAGLPDKVRASWIAEGERFLGWDWPQLTAVGFMEYSRNGNRSNFERPALARRSALATLVLAECMEGQGRFMDDIVNGIWAICEESFWGLPAHNYGPDPLPDVEEPYIDLFAGETAGLLAWTHYLLRDRLQNISPRITRRIRYEMKRRILDPYLERDDFWWLGYDPHRRVNNWNPWCHSNCLTAFLLLEENDERRVQAVAKALHSLDIFLNTYHSDGGCDEGTSYWSRAGGSLFDCLELLYTATEGAVDVYDSPLIAEIGRFLYRAHIDEDWFINFADGNARVHIAADLVYRYGKRIGDPHLMALGAYAHRLRPAAGLRHQGSIFRDLEAIFNFTELDAAPAQSPYVRDVWLDGIQVMVAREQGGTPDGLYLAAKGGHNAESHNHNDVGNFIIYVDGRPAIVDAGVETYTAQTFSSRRYELWTMQSSFHNLPSVNGVQQCPGAGFCAHDVVYRSKEHLAELSLDLRAAYPPEAGIERWKRTLRLHRGDGAASVEIEEDFSLTAPTDDIALHFLVALEPLSIEGGQIHLPQLSIGFDAELLTATCERLALTDARLRQVWGDALCRLVLRARRRMSSGVLLFEVKRT